MAEVRAALAAAHEAAARCDWDAAVQHLTGLQPRTTAQRVAIALLRARAALHAGAPAAALDALDALAGIPGPPDELLHLRGLALVALGRRAEGIQLLEQAVAVGSGEDQADARLDLAAAYLQSARAEGAAVVLDAALAAPSNTRAGRARRARALLLYGRLEVGRQRRAVAALLVRDALDALNGQHQHHALLRAQVLHALVRLATQTLDLRLLKRARAAVAAADWTPAIVQGTRRAVLRLLALGDLLEGDVHSAWELGDAARIDAPRGAERIAADLLAARIAQAWGETFTPARLHEQVLALAAQVGWADSGEAGRRTLLATIAATAHLDPVQGRALLDRYEDLGRDDAGLPPDDPDDLRALEQLARAALAGAEGNQRRQAAALRRAAEDARAGGHAFRELQALLQLAELTRDQDALEGADALSRLVPRSWLRRAYEATDARAALAELSPAEWKVMRALIEGLSSKQIAERFKRSPNTIRNQTRRVYDVLGVRSRSALVVRALALGVLEPGRPPGA